MAVTDEYFDQVIFVELNRAGSPRYLDEMKASLDSKSGLSPCSRESSIQSYNSTSTQYSPESSMQPYSSSPVKYPCESSIQSFNSTPVQYSRDSSIQSYNNHSFPYQRTSSDSAHRQSSLPYQPMLTPPYGNYSINTFLPTDDFNHHRSYIGYDQSGRNDIETRTTVHVGVSDLYQSNQTYGVGDNYYPANSGSSNFSPGGATNIYQGGLVEPPYCFSPGSATNNYQSGLVEPPKVEVLVSLEVPKLICLLQVNQQFSLLEVFVSQEVSKLIWPLPVNRQFSLLEVIVFSRFPS